VPYLSGDAYRIRLCEVAVNGCGSVAANAEVDGCESSRLFALAKPQKER